MALQPDRFREPVEPVILGQGSFGKVSQALDLTTGHLVAIKTVIVDRNDEESISKLIGEITLMKKLSHPNIVKYIGAMRNEDHVKIFLEYISGGSLGGLLQKYGALPETLVKIYTRDMLMGLHYLHASRIAHRDIKCENLLLSCQGCVKLADFGTSKQQEQTMTNTLTGTVWFMAPEVSSGEGYDPFLADIWSVGITVCQMIQGFPPCSRDPRFHSPMQYIMYLARSGDVIPPFPENLSPDCWDFLSKCIVRQPTARWPVEHLLNHRFMVENIPQLVMPSGAGGIPRPPSATMGGPSPRSPRPMDGSPMPVPAAMQPGNMMYANNNQPPTPSHLNNTLSVHDPFKSRSRPSSADFGANGGTIRGGRPHYVEPLQHAPPPPNFQQQF